ncbi:RAM signaling pathway protein-domain-containing protein [Scheffersomyces coipomensis]|uniref:RAM signaling pathway protein-domain-containing protein n=1 Tax=Scheffersomyces coipomensis TaxID=1788519 RepID=UPI00315D71EA
MSSSLKSYIFSLLDDQIDSISQTKTIKLNNILNHTGNGNDNTTGSSDNNNGKVSFSFLEVIEIVYEFLYSFNPPFECERLSLQNNHLTELALINSTSASFSFTSSFTSFLSTIRYLDLHNNQISQISDEIYHELSRLEIFDLSNNKLNHLSNSIINLRNLRILSIKDNKFKILPSWLSDMNSLNLIEILGNPLVIPPTDLIKSLNSNANDLKLFLSTNRETIDSKVYEQFYNTLSRTRSISDTKSKASRAARRMGLIIKKPQDINNEDDDENGGVTTTSNNITPIASHNTSTVIPEIETNGHSNNDISNITSSLNDLIVPMTSTSTSVIDSTFSAGTPPFLTVSTTTATTVPNSPTVSTSKSSGGVSSNPNSNTSTLSRPSSRNRSRSNTLKEIDKILEKNENVDTEHKSGAYFRRLSTLQENPGLEVKENSSLSTSPTQKVITNNNKIHHFNKTDEIKQTAIPIRLGSNNNSSQESSIATASPTKVSFTSPKRHSSSVIVKVSRKILFSFSELHSSVRRFTGFCSDKKITMKMVSYLYATKSNIDSLVENLELMEENSNNLDQIITCLQTCIGSFKLIMNLLNENFVTFVNKIDVCFIRMLYLTLYGSLNELLNAYKILVPEFSITSEVQPINDEEYQQYEKERSQIQDHEYHEYQKQQEEQYHERVLYHQRQLEQEQQEWERQQQEQAFYQSNDQEQHYQDQPDNDQQEQPQDQFPREQNQHDSQEQSQSQPQPEEEKETPPQVPQKLTINTNFSHDDVDEKLYSTVEIATTTAQTIFSELNRAISKSAMATATSSNPTVNQTVAAKVKELTNVCLSSLDVTKRLRTKLVSIRNSPSQNTKKLFGEDINSFIKAMIQTLATVKGIAKDLPILDDIRDSMSHLTRTCKEVTYMLELSSYKGLTNSNGDYAGPPPLSAMPSVSNIFTPVSHTASQTNSLSNNTNSSSVVNLAQLSNNSLLVNSGGPAPVRTPLVATLGPAAQAIMPSNTISHNTNSLENGPASAVHQTSGFNSSPLASPNIGGNGPVTAPPQSSGQFYASHGMNPFDGLIMAQRQSQDDHNGNDH